MATHEINLLNAHVSPFDGNSWFAPYKTLNSGSTQDPMVLVMDQGAVSYVQGAILIPKNYVGTPFLVVVWTSETTTNTVDFKFRHRTIDGSDSELLDIATSPDEREDVGINNGGPSAASEKMVYTDALTSTDLTAGELMYFEFERDGATDDKAAEISVWGLYFRYNDA